MHFILNLIPKKFYVYGATILIVSLLVLIMGIFIVLVNNTSQQGTDFGITFDTTGFEIGSAPLNELVEGYRDDIYREAMANGITQYTDLILALIMQESAGRGSDPMKSSESLCGYIGCITSPQASITQGVKHFKNVMESAGQDVLLGLQSYNFGGGFIDYAKEKNGGKYSKELAIEFSQMMYSQLAYTGKYSCIRGDSVPTGACYGDPLYVDAVLKYYHPKSVAALDSLPLHDGSALANASGKLKLVLTEAYKYEGMPYVFGGNNPEEGFDCSSLMQWIFKEANVNLPRTANEQYKAATKITQAQLKPGDLVFFSGTYNAGVTVTHVGIYIGNGKMYDTHSVGVGETDLTNSYWKSHLYAYGRVANFDN
ncbi:endopeptidase [Bacillus sp. AFS002410]|uniref:bifunctional lytic transglycosylase/C40 family peptidase n=1 Tax=Bacillus sp. AFS002410 TaxID=2033481 RepID=UPI000BF24999|nr:bifunctional lytic transglycosylase/C40 family peptidase [Bacillus sp. AFS002410]PEJ57961.1 endopeptidase [Bacillus sp. AFS002410]